MWVDQRFPPDQSTDVVLPRAGTVVGSLNAASGCWSIYAASSRPYRLRSGIVVGDQFRIDRLAPGRYTLHVRCRSTSGDLEVEVLPGQTTTVGVPMAGYGDIEVRAQLFPGGGPVNDVNCGAEDGGQTNTPRAPDVVVIQRVPPGQRKIYCSQFRPGERVHGEASVQVSPGSTTRATVYVVVTPNQSRRAGAHFELQGAGGATVLMVKRAFDKTFGLEDGDIILQVAGEAATGEKAMAARAYLADRPGGTVVQLVVERGGRGITTEVRYRGSQP
jgi:hypothetical protein